MQRINPPLLANTDTTLYVNHTAFVDSKYGNDSTAQLEIPAYPYKTINAAITAASIVATSAKQWQVQIRPGTYNENISLKNFVNLIGISSLPYLSPPQNCEIQINGAIDDSSITNGTPNITNLSFSSTNTPVITFTSGSLITIVDCTLIATYNNNATSCVTVSTNNGTDVVFRRSHITLQTSDFTTEYTATTIELLGGLGADIILENCVVDVTLDGTGVPNATSISATNIGNLSSESITSNSTTYSFGFTTQSGVASSATYQTFGINNASVLSRNDDVEIIVVPNATIMSLVNAGTSSQADILDMVVNFVTSNPSPLTQISTFNNNGNNSATGYFDNIRFRGINTQGIANSIPTQTPTNSSNTYRQINVLTDSQLAGQDLLGITTVTTTPYNVLEIDAVILYEGSGTGTITLPLAASYTGRKITIKNTTTNNLTISTTDSNMIDGSTSVNLTLYQSVGFISDGNNTWWTI